MQLPYNRTVRLAGSVTHRILAMKFASEFMLIYPLYPIMFSERGGVSAAGVGLLLATISVLTVVFEIPTGIIADRVSRKYILLAAFSFKALCMTAWLAFPSFAGYLLGAACLALSFALESGAIQAYLYGTLGSDAKRRFGRFWSQVTALVMLAWSLAYLTTTAIGIRYGLILGLTIGSCLVSLGICLTLPKDTVAASNTDVRPKVFRSAVRHLTASGQFKSLLTTAILVVGLALLTIQYIGPYYNQSGVPTRWVPLLMAGGNLVGTAMFWSFHAWESWLDRHKLKLAIICGILFGLSFLGGTAGAVLGFLLVARFVRILQLQFEATIQHLANDEARATIASIANFAANLSAAAMMALVGLFAVNDVVIRPLRVVLLGGLIVYVVFYLYSRKPVATAR